MDEYYDELCEAHEEELKRLSSNLNEKWSKILADEIGKNIELSNRVKSLQSQVESLRAGLERKEKEFSSRLGREVEKEREECEKAKAEAEEIKEKLNDSVAKAVEVGEKQKVYLVDSFKHKVAFLKKVDAQAFKKANEGFGRIEEFVVIDLDTAKALAK